MSGFTENFLKNHGKATIFVEGLMATSGGWELGESGADDIQFRTNETYQPLNFYVCNRKNPWVFLAQVDLSQALDIASRVAAEPAAYADVRSSLAFAINEASHNRPVSLDGFSATELLGALLSMYLGTTQTYQQLRHEFVRGAHFVIVGYGKPSTKAGLNLRPFIVPRKGGNAGPLPAEDLVAVVSEVEYIDRQRHPEWFQ